MKRLWMAVRYGVKSFLVQWRRGSVDLADPYYIVKHGLTGKVFYEGDSAIGARRVIEGMRADRMSFEALRGGHLWDWGPR